MKKIAFLVFAFCSTVFGYQAIVVDPYLSPYAGAYDLLFASDLLVKAEDYFRRSKMGDGTIDVSARSLEQIFFWMPLNMVTSVAQHEFFGHGYRLRELGVKPKKYEITPWGGSTSFELDNDFPIGEFIAVGVAGLEAEAILAQRAKMNWIGAGVIDGRLSTLYTQSQQSIFWYTLITQLGKIKTPSPFSGNDVEGYLALLNASYPEDQMSIGDLTLWASFNWLDPMTFFAYASWFYYIATGNALSFPMIQLSPDLCYLPNVRIGYAPYAPEAYLENYFSFRGEPLYFYLKGGKRSAGLGGAYDKLLCGERGTIGLHLDGWWQREYITSATLGDLEEGLSIVTSELDHSLLGIAASLTSTLNLGSSMALFAEIGGKTKGYLPGYALGAGVVARIGLVVGGR